MGSSRRSARPLNAAGGAFVAAHADAIRRRTALQRILFAAGTIEADGSLSAHGGTFRIGAESAVGVQAAVWAQCAALAFAVVLRGCDFVARRRPGMDGGGASSLGEERDLERLRLGDLSFGCSGGGSRSALWPREQSPSTGIRGLPRDGWWSPPWSMARCRLRAWLGPARKSVDRAASFKLLLWCGIAVSELPGTPRAMV